MTNDEKNQPTKEPHPRDITRRDFATILVGAGIAAGVSSTAAAEVGMEMVETDVEIKTPDGTCDAAFIYPKSHPKSNPAYPGVLIWPTPSACGRRCAQSAETSPPRAIPSWYQSLLSRVQGSFYGCLEIQFPESRRYGELKPLMASVTAPGNAEKDAAAYVAFLDAQREVNKAKKIGTQGYCMGGALVVRTAAALPDRIGAARRSTAEAW